MEIPNYLNFLELQISENVIITIKAGYGPISEYIEEHF
jgi:hypothetical protein